MPVFRPFALLTFFTVPILFGVALHGTAAAQDVRHMCSEKYQAAKTAGTLGEQTWPQFYSRCVAELKANPPAAATTPQAAKSTPAPLDIRHLCSEKYQAAKAAGTLGGASWPQFYSRCTAEAKANPPAAAPPAAEAAAPEEKAPAPPPASVVEAPTPSPPAPVVEAPPPPAPTVAETPPPPAAAPAPAPAQPPAPVNPLKKPAAKPTARAAPAAPSTAVFPTAIAPEFAGEKPAKARLKTCAAQWKANKATNANGGMKWTQKGGGYMSECIKRLKGE